MNLKIFLLTGTIAVSLAAPADAQTGTTWASPRAGDWIVTGRATNVAPTTEAGIFTAAGADTSLDVGVSDDVMPTLGFTYFFTDNIAVEAILGTTKHEVRARGGATDVAVHETWVLPPVVTFQWRPLTGERFSPYVGAGVSAMIFYSGEDKNGFTVDLDDGIGGALQMGADIGLTGPWSLNLDVKKIWFSTSASINEGAMISDVDLDPWVVSVGVGRKF